MSRLDNLFTLQLDVFEKDETHIPSIIFEIFYIFITNNQFEQIINKSLLFEFISEVCQKYNDVPYHNICHALQVLNTTWVIMNDCNMFKNLHPVISFATLISALTHDIGHPGTNNGFQLRSNSEIYQSFITLENFHYDTTNKLIQKHNVLSKFSNSDIELFNKTIQQCILATAPEDHNLLFTEMQQKLKNQIDYSNIEEQIYIAKIMMVGADLGNPILDFSLCHNWSAKIQDEFRHQIDSEKRANLTPSMAFENDRISYKMELGYIKHIQTFWRTLYFAFPELEQEYCNFLNNKKTYDRFELSQVTF